MAARTRKAHAESGTLTVHYRIIDADLVIEFSTRRLLRTTDHARLPLSTLVDMAQSQVTNSGRDAWIEARQEFALGEKEEQHG